MDYSQKSLLLPEGQSINHDGNALEIIRKIGSGFTSEVYEAYLNKDQQRIHVAVKVMRIHGISKEIRKFNQEYTTLSNIYSIQKKASQAGYAISVPATYGLSTYENRSYFVMDFLNVKNIPELLAESIEFSEKEIVIISEQLFQLLHILHNDLKKTYIDLKLENLWYDHDNQRLIMTDFGTLEELKEFGVRRDLLTASIYMFGVYSGYFISAANGVLLENPIQMVIDTDLTDGVKDLFYRLLHPNVNVRPTSAGEIADEMRLFRHTWMRTDEENVRLLQSLLNDAKDQLTFDINQAAQHAKDMQVIYSILKRKGDVERLVNNEDEIQRILAQTDLYARIKHEFKRASYNQSRKLAEQFLEAKPNDKKSEEVRKWYLLSRIAEKFPAEIKSIEDDLLLFVDPASSSNEYLGGMTQLSEHTSWDKVYKLLSEVIPDRKEINHLINENLYSTEISLFLDSFAKKDYQSANEHLAKAKQAADGIADEGVVQTGSILNRQEIAYFEAVISELYDHQKKLTSDLNQALALAQTAQWEALSEKLTGSYPSSVVSQQHLSQFDQIGLIALKLRGFDIAHQSFWLGKKYAAVKRPYWTKLRITSLLKALFDAKTTLELDQIFDDLVGSHHTIQQDELLPGMVVEVIDDWMGKSGKGEDFHFVKRYQEFLNQIGERQKAADLTEAVKTLSLRESQRISEKANFLFDEASSQYYLDKQKMLFHKRSLADALKLLFDLQHRLDECTAKLETVVQIAPTDHLKQKSELLLKKIEQDKLNHQKLIEKRQEALERSTARELPEIRRDWKAYENLYSLFITISDQENLAPQEVAKNITEQLKEKTSQLLQTTVTYLSVYDTSNEEVLGYFREIINRVEAAGGPDWQVFLTTDPGDNVAELRKLSEAQKLYLEGNSAQGLTILNSFVPEITDLKKWLELKNKLNEAAMFVAWSGEFNLINLPKEAVNEKLDQTSKFLDRPIPLVYWQKSMVPQKISEYYQETYKQLMQTNLNQTQLFVEHLQQFFRVELLIQRLPDEIRPQIKINQRGAGR